MRTTSPLAFSLAIALILTGTTASAARRGGPEAAARYEQQAEGLQTAGKTSEALKYYRMAVEADPTNLGDDEAYGKALFAAGKYAEAAQLFRQLATRDDPAAFWNLGYALRKTGDYAAAADAYAQFEQGSPEDPDAYYMLAEVYRQLQRYQEAAQQYDLYVQKETRADQAEWVEKAKKKSAAMKDAMARANTVVVALPVSSAPAAASTPQPAAVVALPTASANRDPNAAMQRIMEGDTLFKQGRYREALQTYQDAVRFDEQSTNALLKEGLAFANMSYYREAISMWQHVLQIDPGNAYAPKYIAKAQTRVDPNAPAYDPNAAQPVQAGGAAAPAPTTVAAAPAAPAQVSPEDEAAAREDYKKALDAYRGQQYEAAIAILDSAIQKNPGYANALIARGNSYFGLHKYKEAVADYQRSLTLTTTLATPVYGLARSYDRLGDKENACTQYRRYASSIAVDVQPALRKQAQDQVTSLCGG